MSKNKFPKYPEYTCTPRPPKHPSDYMHKPPKKGKKFKHIKPIPPTYGYDNFQNYDNLRVHMNGVIEGYNKLVSNNERYLHSLWSHTFDHGAYYHRPEVWFEEGYSGDEGGRYQVIHKSDRDRKGCPIPMRLHLAYGNHTNSKLKEDADLVSFFEKAQFVIPAYPVNDDVGYYGHTIVKYAPIPSTAEEELYTVGFTQSGRMKYYSNKTRYEQLRRDRIETATGCLGVLVTGGEVADPSLYEGITNRDEAIARIAIGQNYKTKETFIFSCGDYDNNGFTSAGVADIMKSYGCDIAVEICNGNDAVCLFKGKPMFIPSDTKLGNNYGYWYTSRKKYYRDVCTHEVADLVQLYGMTWYRSYLNSLAINRLEDEINNIKTDITNLENRVTDLEGKYTDLEARVVQLEADIVRIDSEIEAINKDIADVVIKLDKEIADRIAEVERLDNKIDTEVTRLDGKIDTEIQDRKDADAVLQALIDRLRLDIDQEVLDRIAGDSALDAKISQEIQDRINAISDLQTKINDINTRIDILTNTVQTNYNTLLTLINANSDLIAELQERQVSVEVQLQKVNETITEILANLSTIEQSLENLKTLVLELQTLPGRMTEVEQKVESLEIIVNELDGKVTVIEGKVDDVIILVNTFDERITHLEEHPFVVSVYGALKGNVAIFSDIDSDGHAGIEDSTHAIGSENYTTVNYTTLATQKWVEDYINTEIEDLLTEINDKVNQIQTGLDALTIIVNQHTTQITNLGNRITNVEGDVSNLTDDLENLKSQPFLVRPPEWGASVTGILTLNGRNSDGYTRVDTTGFTAGLKTYLGGGANANKITNEEWVESYTDFKYADLLADIERRLVDLEFFKDECFSFLIGGGEMTLYEDATGNGLGALDLSYMRFKRSGNIVEVHGAFNLSGNNAAELPTIGTTYYIGWRQNNQDYSRLPSALLPFDGAPIASYIGMPQVAGLGATSDNNTRGAIIKFDGSSYNNRTMKVNFYGGIFPTSTSNIMPFQFSYLAKNAVDRSGVVGTTLHNFSVINN